MKQPFRTGFGFDVHAFADNRKLIIGGIEIPHEKGLAGHSDADVLLHAICDAMLGALALGDIGIHFPNTDPKWKDADSSILLAHCKKLVDEKGYEVSNIDCALGLEKPKLLPFLDKIRNKISVTLNINVDQISVKATTAEKLGFVGRGEGVACFATALLIKKDLNA